MIAEYFRRRRRRCRLVGAAGVNGLSAAAAAATAAVGAGVQRSYLIHSINYGSIRNVAFLFPSSARQAWLGRRAGAGGVGGSGDRQRDRGAGGRKAGG